MFQELLTEVLLIGVYPQVLSVEAHLAEPVLQGDEPLAAAQLLVEPLVQVVPRAGMLKTEALHPHEAPLLSGDDAEAPFTALHMIGQLTLDTDPGLERRTIMNEVGLHIAVSLLDDHASLPRLFDHLLQLLQLVIIDLDLQQLGFDREAGRIIPEDLTHEGEETGMTPGLELPIGDPRGNEQEQQSNDDEQGPPPHDGRQT